ncbi:hypothetical protein LIA77_01246 [Sarocladium implicatum]|nr:hypothetical protein LIA77_01246 [Sarocladium implicatum]
MAEIWVSQHIGGWKDAVACWNTEGEAGLQGPRSAMFKCCKLTELERRSAGSMNPTSSSSIDEQRHIPVLIDAFLHQPKILCQKSLTFETCGSLGNRCLPAKSIYGNTVPSVHCASTCFAVDKHQSETV